MEKIRSHVKVSHISHYDKHLKILNKPYKNLLQTLKSLVPIVQAHGEKHSSSGRSANLKKALETLHSMSDKPCEMSEQLMLPTLGSQEGAFENVRMSYSGEQGQTIRQLMNAHMVRRVVMCCLSSGKRQHLAVAHEKGNFL